MWIAIAAAMVFAGCATTSSQDLSLLVPVREATVRVTGPWTRAADALLNTVPADVPIESGQVRDGSGVSVALLPDFTARDVVVEGKLAFTGQGAPGLVFRAQEQDGVVTAMYTLALYRNGVNLWRLSNGRWQLIHAQVMRVEENTTHSLRVEARGDTIKARLNGSALFKARDTGLLAPGRVGVRGVEGPCRFFEVNVRER